MQAVNHFHIPPRYSKTELAVVNWVAWCMGRHPDAEFIHASYSAALAINNSRNCRDLTQHEAFSEIFPEFLLFSDAGHDWRTTQGGVMYATGAEGTITGFGAGKHRAEFGGCFPVGTRVWTEFGLMPIDRIVKEPSGQCVVIRLRRPNGFAASNRLASKPRQILSA